VNRKVFAARFAASVRAAREFAQSGVSEEFPEPLVFRVRLDQSYDGHGPQRGTPVSDAIVPVLDILLRTVVSEPSISSRPRHGRRTA
jgi:hypothetical protein